MRSALTNFLKTKTIELKSQTGDSWFVFQLANCWHIPSPYPHFPYTPESLKPSAASLICGSTWTTLSRLHHLLTLLVCFATSINITSEFKWSLATNKKNSLPTRTRSNWPGRWNLLVVYVMRKLKRPERLLLLSGQDLRALIHTLNV